MKIETRGQVLELLRMDEADFRRELLPAAGRAVAEQKGGITVGAMLGYSNICKNQCLYCGMRAGNSGLERYRVGAEEVKAALKSAWELGFRRIFFVSGEDPKYGFDSILDFVSYGRDLGFFISLGAGELERSQYRALHDAGVAEYVIKFEMARRETFNRLNPSTDFDRRMEAIYTVKEQGYRLASGNIIDYPGQTLDMLADDIMLMRELDISWAPVIPYMPAKGTPLAREGGFGRLDLLYKEIAILRLMLPGVDITAQQPGKDVTQGLSGVEGNAAAVAAGGNMLFVDLLPDALAKSFSVVDNRSALGLDAARRVAASTGMELSFLSRQTHE